jgi:selenocysteine-specific elongation factor
MPFIIGTAGHIDHGKTSLVKALTGQDTDRLKEEQERGISIELGFAHLDLPDGTRAGVVDVPGHERFIRTMLAGAHGMDIVLVTIAADDGVMPQTVEHLDILHLLGVTRAIFVITKTDLATAARVAEVEGQIQRLAAGTKLAGSPVVPFSFTTGDGRERILDEVSRAVRLIDRGPPSGYFRLPVDRVFVLQGHGVVVTGTALQGEINAGDRVRRLPGGELLRIRSLQVHGQPVPSATWGQRVALNLSGPQRTSLERGDMLCDERLTTTTDRFDASLAVRPTATVIANHLRVRIHMGTAERFGKLVVLGLHDSAAPGDSTYCQIVLAKPLPVLRGDHFIVRDEAAQRTLGGGTVLHPSARAHRRSDARLMTRLQVLESGDPAAVAELFLDDHDEFALPISSICQFLNLRVEDAVERLRGAAGIRAIRVDGDELFTTERKWNEMKERLVAALRAFHAAHPLEQGEDVEELRDRLMPSAGARLFRAFVETLETDHAVARAANLLRLTAHRVSLDDEDRRTAEQITRLLGVNPVAPADVAQIAREAGIDRTRIVQVLRVLEREHAVVRVAPDLYFLPDTVEDVKRIVREELSDRPDITPAMFRDRLGITRKHAIPLLEYLDAAGVTLRIGGRRTVRSVRLRPDQRAAPKSESG